MDAVCLPWCNPDFLRTQQPTGTNEVTISLVCELKWFVAPPASAESVAVGESPTITKKCFRVPRDVSHSDKWATVPLLFFPWALYSQIVIMSSGAQAVENGFLPCGILLKESYFSVACLAKWLSLYSLDPSSSQGIRYALRRLSHVTLEVQPYHYIQSPSSTPTMVSVLVQLMSLSFKTIYLA